jgi:hypothetical protein
MAGPASLAVEEPLSGRRRADFLFRVRSQAVTVTAAARARPAYLASSVHFVHLYTTGRRSSIFCTLAGWTWSKQLFKKKIDMHSPRHTTHTSGFLPGTTSYVYVRCRTYTLRHRTSDVRCRVQYRTYDIVRTILHTILHVRHRTFF